MKLTCTGFSCLSPCACSFASFEHPKCTRLRLRALKFSKFPGGHAPGPPPVVRTFGAQVERYVPKLSPPASLSSTSFEKENPACRVNFDPKHCWSCLQSFVCFHSGNWSGFWHFLLCRQISCVSGNAYFWSSGFIALKVNTYYKKVPLSKKNKDSQIVNFTVKCLNTSFFKLH